MSKDPKRGLASCQILTEIEYGPGGATLVYMPFYYGAKRVGRGVFFVKMTIMAVPNMKTTSGSDFCVYFRGFFSTNLYKKILKTEKVTSIVPILYGG